jgi:hypothetical protein
VPRVERYLSAGTRAEAPAGSAPASEEGAGAAQAAVKVASIATASTRPKAARCRAMAASAARNCTSMNPPALTTVGARQLPRRRYIGNERMGGRLMRCGPQPTRQLVKIGCSMWYAAGSAIGALMAGSTAVNPNNPQQFPSWE